MEVKKVVNLQVAMGCSRNCEPCSKYFSCNSKLKYDIYHTPALKKIEERMKTIKYKIAIMSGKGGVGKSTSTGGLAYALNLLGRRVGVLDSDFYGPSMATILGVFGEIMNVGPDGLLPLRNSQGIQVASVASVLGEADYVSWMGDQIRWALYTFLGNTQWDDLDYLLIDLPPGTGEETLNVMKAIRGLSGGVIVTIPSEVSQIVVGRGISLCKEAGTRILGLIENMGTMTCPSCHSDIDVFMSGGGRRIAEKSDVHFLGNMPLDRRISESCDEGVPFMVKYQDSLAAQRFKDIAGQIVAMVEGAGQNE